MTLNTARSTFASVLIISSLVTVSFLSLQCITKPLEPIAPSWDVQLSVPLLDTTRNVEEMVEKDTSVIQSDPGNNLIHYKFNNPAVSDSIGDRISVRPRSARARVRLGAISVNDFQIADTVSPFPSGPPSPVPAQTIRTPSPPSASVQDFSSLTLQSGTAQLTITNNLPIAIAFPETLSIRDGLGRVVASFGGITGQIPPGGTLIGVDPNLGGRTINNVLRILTVGPPDSITISTPGSGGNPVTFGPSSNVFFDLQFTNLVVSTATLAVIPAQTLVSRDSSTIVVDDSTFIQSLTFKSGNFAIKLTNKVDLGVLVRLQLPQLLRRSDNTSYDSTATIQRNDSISVPFDMRQYRISSPTPTRFLVYTVQISQLGSSGVQYRTVTANDSVVADANISPPDTLFVAESGSGVIKPTAVNINQPVSLSLGDLPTKFKVDSIRLPDASITLSLRTPVPARVSAFRIVARKGSGAPDTIQYRDNRTLYLLPPPVINQVLLVDTNSTIVDVLNRFVAGSRTLPDSFRIVGNGLLNHNYDTMVAYTVADTSKIAGDVDVDFPMNIGIKNGTVRDTVDIADKFSINQEDIDRLNSGTLTVRVLNFLPAELRLLFVMLNNNRDSTWSFPRAGPIVVAAAPLVTTGPLAGFSSGSTQSIVPLTIDRQDVRALVDAKFLRVDIILNTSTGASSVKFRTTDAIKTRVYGTLSYRISFSR